MWQRLEKQARDEGPGEQKEGGAGRNGGGGFFVLDPNGEESGAPVRRGCTLLLGLFKELELFDAGSAL